MLASKEAWRTNQEGRADRIVTKKSSGQGDIPTSDTSQVENKIIKTNRYGEAKLTEFNI